MPTPIIILLVAFGVMLLFFGIFLFLVKPSGRRGAMEKFKNVRYAHRGLHSEDAAENSITAFSRAVEAGYGIELDVRLSRDGELVVFHDPTLDRVTNSTGKVIDKTLAELRELRLLGTEDCVPTLREVLSVVDGKIPLLIELKEEPGEYGVTEKTLEILKDYKGAYMIESFNPLALARVKKLAPDTVRGFLSQNFGKTELRGFRYFLLEHLFLNVICRPDFIAYSHTDANMPIFRFVKAFFRVPCLAWTVESPDADKCALENGFSGVIFQHYKPKTHTKNNP